MVESTECIRINNLQAYYGESHVLHGVTMHVNRGEVVTLLGRNGSGRTTTLRALMGLMNRSTGEIQIDGKDVLGLAPHKIARMGVGYCPEERGIFASLTCEENLLLPPQISEGGMSVAEIYRLFPNLQERANSQGTKLSGGEQQMLAIGRILRTGVRILLLDEISEGLAPVIVQTLDRAIRALKKQGYTIILVEQNFRFAAPLADRFYIMEHGQVVEGFEARELESKMNMLNEFLGV